MKTYKLRESKRGQVIGEAWALFYTTLFIVLFAIAFLIMIRMFMTHAENAKAAESFALEQAAKASLTSYLETPISVPINGKSTQMKIQELIQLTNVNNSYKSILESESKSIFESAYDSKYKLEISSWLSIGFKESTIYNPDLGEDVPISESIEFYSISLPNNLEVKLSLKK